MTGPRFEALRGYLPTLPQRQGEDGQFPYEGWFCFTGAMPTGILARLDAFVGSVPVQRRRRAK